MRPSPITPTLCTGSSTAKAWLTFVVPARRAQLLEEDGVGLLQERHPLGGDLAEHAHREAGAREGMAADDLLGQPQLAAELAHLVLEQEAQRLDQLEPQVARAGRRRCGGS